MPGIIGAVVGALAVIGIPIVAWLSRRVTQEGRRMLRVERLGTVYAVMPDSPEKDAFKVHVTGAIASLNSWLDPDNARRRRIVRGVSTVTYVVGVILVLVTVPFVDATKNPWFSSLFGIVIGFGIALITFGTSYILDRSTRAKKSREAAQQERAAAAARMDALMRGEAP
ncbi:MAG TPA: hypothetical protein VHZ98_16450 [Galbitalea sp.]|jgi:MFS family permease|nr:hypothetical protein [Galbitalea sp.]